MATIALNANKINQMPTMIKQMKQSVEDYKSELFALKNQTLTINQSVCNLSDVVNSIQASTQTQEDKIDSLDDLMRENEEFISDVVHIDEEVADVINQRKEEFYEDYYYLKPECEKNWLDKVKDGLVSAAEWCKENWQSIVKVVVAVVVIAALGVLSVVTGGIIATILAGAFWGALSGALISGVSSGLTNMLNGGSFFEGFADGALSGALTGALTGAAFAGLGVAGSAFGKFMGGSCRFAENADKILKVLECTSKITGVLSLGMGAFDTAAMVAGFFNPDSVLVKLNQQLHSNSLYNDFQFVVTITAVFTGSAYASMRERMKFPPTCFVAGTMILTVGGLVAIENIKVGDKVVATNPDSFEIEEKTVVETYVHETSQLIHLTIHGENIITTWNHPFYVKDRGFIKAEDLQVGNPVVNADGEIYTIENHQVEIVETPERVYNFQVEDFHTYHVGNAGVLVHNADCSSGGYTGGRSEQELKELAEDPAHSGSTRTIDIAKGEHEARVGLDLEERGFLNRIQRDKSGKAEFIDGNGQAWDIKSFNSNYKPNKGGFRLDKAMNTINKSLSENENVIIDTSNMSAEHIIELTNELNMQGVIDKILFWP